MIPDADRLLVVTALEATREIEAIAEHADLSPLGRDRLRLAATRVRAALALVETFLQLRAAA